MKRLQRNLGLQSHTQYLEIKKRGIVRSVRLTIISLVGITGLLMLIALRQSVNSPSVVAQDITPATIKNQSVGSGGSAQPTKPTSSKTTPNTVIVASVPSCVRPAGTQSPQVPNDSPAIGLVQTPEITSYYTIFGNTRAQISNQMYQCSPVLSGNSRFSANTEYVLTWSFQYQSSVDDLCTISNARVGLGIAKTFPKWQASNDTPQGLSARWNTFMNNLTIHEEGHAQLDRDYAQQILTSLQNFPPSACDTISAGANAKANSIMSALNQANEAYDQATEHGANQGAKF